MKGMVQVDGSSLRGEALHVRGRSEHRSSSVTAMIVSRAMMVEAAPSPKVARRNLTTWKNVKNCRIRRRGKIILMVRLVLLLLLKILNQIAWLCCWS